MTPPPLSDQKLRVDAVDELRVLGAELRALAKRLELKARNHELQPTLKALEQRLSGPHAVVMLVSEHEELKRRFLERLLGPDLAQVPKPTTACVRLEYGTAPQSAERLPSAQTIDAIRMLNPTLKSGLAVIDTPAFKSGEPSAPLLECAEDADACILVLDRDYELSDESYVLLGQLPEAGARLEIVVENAEALRSEERMAARERLLQKLRERCNIETPRLTLIASSITEDDGASFWHGRFATFHSVMMRRGRRHWLMVTRTMVADALAQVTAEIEFELKDATPGPRHGQLRLGMKDLEGLRTRFEEMSGAISTDPAETKTLNGGPAHRNGQSDGSPGASELPGASEAVIALAAPVMPGDSARAVAPECTATPEAPSLASTPGLESGPKRELFAHFRANLTRWTQHARAIPIPRTAGIALGIALVCLLVWALSPRGFFGREAGAEWDYHPPKLAPAEPSATSSGKDGHGDLPKPGDAPQPETSRPAAPNIPMAPPVKPSAAVRMPLARPIPSGATAGVAPRTKRHHRHLLGLGKLWHWVRHDNRKDTSSRSKETSQPD
jgi:hypothetical protein